MVKQIFEPRFVDANGYVPVAKLVARTLQRASELTGVLISLSQLLDFFLTRQMHHFDVHFKLNT